MYGYSEYTKLCLLTIKLKMYQFSNKVDQLLPHIFTLEKATCLLKKYEAIYQAIRYTVCVTNIYAIHSCQSNPI